MMSKETRYQHFTNIGLNIVAFLSAVAPDFSHNQLKSQTLVKVGGDVLIECKPKMSPWGVIFWRKGSEPLRENNR